MRKRPQKIRRPQPKETLSFDLQANAFDFMRKAIEEAGQKEPRAWKYSLLHLVSGIELLMKAILEKEHWSLLFDDINKANKEKLSAGDFRSVDFNTAKSRLQNIIGMERPKQYDSALMRLYDLRNKITHFRFEISEVQIKSLVEKGWSIFLSLYEEGFGQDADEEIIYEITESLSQFEGFVRKRLGQIASKLEKADRPSSLFRSCSSCGQEALVIKGEETKCLFCGAEANLLDLAYRYEGYECPCPVCDAGHLCFVLYNNEEGAFHCVCCDYTCDHSYRRECSRCGETYWDEDGSPFCSLCWEGLMND